MRGAAVVLVLLLAAPVVAAQAVEYGTERAGCGSSPLGSNYRVVLRAAGVEDCLLRLDAAGTAACTASACEFDVRAGASVHSGHPGERALGVFFDRPQPVVVCEDRRDAGDAQCEGAVRFSVPTGPDGCARVDLHARYIENLGVTGTSHAGARWTACLGAGGSTTLTVDDL